MDRYSLCAQASLPEHRVTSSLGSGEALQPAVSCPGPSVSGFLALHNFSISAKYICHLSPSGDWNVQTLEAKPGKRMLHNQAGTLPPPLRACQAGSGH